MRWQWMHGLGAFVVAAILGCGSTTAGRREDGSVHVPARGSQVGVYVQLQEEGPGAFFPEDWARVLAGVASSEVGIQPASRRPPRRRGGWELGRQPPPLLNPRPSPEQAQARARRAADLTVQRQAQDLYYQRLKEARASYPEAKGYENHHFIPRYLGGDPKGQTYWLPKAYHIAMTQAFRQRWEYGRERPAPQELREILVYVYSRYPIPQLIGIEP
jgi:hypothetical protein